MALKTNKLIVVNDVEDNSEQLRKSILYNRNSYDVREFSQLIGSNMGWLQKQLSYNTEPQRIIETIKQVKPPTLQRNVKSLSKISGVKIEVIWGRIDRGELFGDIQKDLLS